MSKVNAIRKKALDFVRKRDWSNAIKEYRRLADLDQSNPNVFNELGDIYLKTGNKSDAYDAFSHAIDSYTRVSLHNNAVAVCKKVLRLIPARFEVLTKLGLIRKKQGLGKEAESNYLSFLDKVLADQQISPVDVQKSCEGVVDEMPNAPLVLEKLYECLMKFNLKEDAVAPLQGLHAFYSRQGDSGGRDHARQRLQDMGVAPEEPGTDGPGESKDGVVITEENIWSESHTEGERMDVGGADGQAPAPMGAGDDRPDSVYEYGDMEIGEPQAGGDPTSTQTVPESGAPGEGPETAEPVYDVTPPAEPGVVAPDAGDSTDSPPTESPPPGGDEEPVSPSPSSGVAGSAENIQVSAILNGGENGGDGDMSDDDYRSHYDLGMAYLEMDLLAEAIREYQLAAKSKDFQARALEMIGLCFLNQNQANLAIKQLTKGLQLIGDDDSESLGIKYNLGLAYEMVGDIERARSAFEDVYVEDVTFRDVAKKIEKYS